MIIELRLFATAREAAGRSHDSFEMDEGATLDGVVDAAVARYGGTFAAVVAGSRIWLNGDEPPTGGSSPLRDGDEVAILPPVSGGASRRSAHTVDGFGL